MNKRGYFDKRLLLIPLGIIVITGIVLILLFNYNECDSWECFNNGLKSCSRTKFIGGTKMIFEYTIKGVVDENCKIDVELLQGELNNKDSLKLQDAKMSCLLPNGVVMVPESDISNCHGLLKEGLQDLVINKLYSYLVQNLGRLNLELIDVEKLKN